MMTNEEYLQNKVDRLGWLIAEYHKHVNDLRKRSLNHQSDLTNIQLICYSAVLAELEAIYYDD